MIGQSGAMTEWWDLSWDDWLASLDDDARQRAVALRDKFAAYGADEPESWVQSEVQNDVAQLARFLFLSATWRRMEWAVDEALNSNTAAELRAAGCDMAKIEQVVKSAVLDVSSNLCYLLDEPDGTVWTEDGARRSDVRDGDPRWMVSEVAADGSLTGRDVGGLHESVQETDPDRNEARGWLA
jgi:hypothetical protein